QRIAVFPAVARPLREQVALATLVLLIPVGAVMTWAAGAAYNDQLVQLRGEAQRVATAVAAHVDQGLPDGGGKLDQFLGAIPLPEGSVVTVTESTGRVVAHYSRHVGDLADELAES